MMSRDRGFFGPLLSSLTGGILGSPDRPPGQVAPVPQLRPANLGEPTAGQQASRLFQNPAFLSALSSFGQTLAGNGTVPGQPIDTGQRLVQGLGAFNQQFAQQQLQSNLLEQQARAQQLDALLTEAKINKLNQEAERGNVGGATGELINRLQAEDPSLSTKEALFLVQTGLREGLEIDEQGRFTPATGIGTARGAIAGAQAGERLKGTKQAEALLDFPRFEAQADEAISLIDSLVEHPGFSVSVGATVQPGARFIPGTDAADFQARFDQVKGKQFLEAFENLKGGGQITEVEGRKATQAISRMSLSQSESEFKRAAKEFVDIIRKGKDRARKSAGLKKEPARGPERIPTGESIFPQQQGQFEFLGFE